LIHARERGGDKLVIAQFNPNNQLITGEITNPLDLCNHRYVIRTKSRKQTLYEL